MARRRRRKQPSLLWALVGWVVKAYVTAVIYMCLAVFYVGMILPFQVAYWAIQKMLRAAAQPERLSVRGNRFVPDSVKRLVWERDGGRCVACGDNQTLEFDHALPFSLGGVNTSDNIQLLCGGCNRSKSAKVWRGPNLRR